MKVAIAKETNAAEHRVALSPDVVKKLCAIGFSVSVQAGAGGLAGITDEAFKVAGASIVKTPAALFKAADVVLAVQCPSAEHLALIPKTALLLAMLSPLKNRGNIEALASKGISAFAMEFMPRITRAQVMDVLSSQANLAGYCGVIEAASCFNSGFPMMMTAAGTVPAAKVFVIGAGVAGLQAIATARRLGAIVSATDVRPASKEQVASLGAKFIAVEDDEFKAAEAAGGYAKEMSDGYKAKQADLVASHIALQDVVITTALVPGRPAPKLISKSMVESMRPGSVIADLAAESGGNCEVTKPGKVSTYQGVHIIGHENWPSRVATSASGLYARNLYAFLETMVDKEKRCLSVPWDDELVKETLVTHAGDIVHSRLIEG